MVRPTGDWMPQPPPPDFPSLPPPACFDETSLGSEVDRMMEAGAQARATSAPSMADDGVGIQAEALGTQSVLGNSESRAQVVALGSSVCV